MKVLHLACALKETFSWKNWSIKLVFVILLICVNAPVSEQFFPENVPLRHGIMALGKFWGKTSIYVLTEVGKRLGPKILVFQYKLPVGSYVNIFTLTKFNQWQLLIMWMDFNLIHMRFNFAIGQQFFQMTQIVIWNSYSLYKPFFI